MLLLCCVPVSRYVIVGDLLLVDCGRPGGSATPPLQSSLACSSGPLGHCEAASSVCALAQEDRPIAQIRLEGRDFVYCWEVEGDLPLREELSSKLLLVEKLPMFLSEPAQPCLILLLEQVWAYVCLVSWF